MRSKALASGRYILLEAGGYDTVRRIESTRSTTWLTVSWRNKKTRTGYPISLDTTYELLETLLTRELMGMRPHAPSNPINAKPKRVSIMLEGSGTGAADVKSTCANEP